MGWISGNRYLNEAEMKNNADIIKSYLASRGWSVNAISALLGNMQSESTINPGIWQSLNEGNMSGGFGLVQWTPATNFTDWADSNGYEWADGEAQLKWIDEVTTSVGQWIPTTEYAISFEDFKTSSLPLSYLTSAFLKNFERAGVEVESERQLNALFWYDYLTSGDSTETPGTTSRKRTKFKFILFNRRRTIL